MTLENSVQMSNTKLNWQHAERRIGRKKERGTTEGAYRLKYNGL
jgi:hypothetical protein